METRKPDQMMPQTSDAIAAKKPWQTPRLTCETEANSAQKIANPLDTLGPTNGPS
jgi:type IV pilus biogenesis protein CpaD/CtpE